jgi:hypothetical protein
VCGAAERYWPIESFGNLYYGGLYFMLRTVQLNPLETKINLIYIIAKSALYIRAPSGAVG